VQLRDRVVLVTGAGRGIGRATALRCADEGAVLALAGRSVGALEEVAEAVRAKGGSALVVPTDVTDEASTAQMAAQVESAHGRVDVLVANSGIGGPTAPLWQLTAQQWDDTHAVNVRGVFLCCRAVLPAMVARGAGAVVLMGSMSGKRPLANRTAYTSSKSALIGLARTLAVEAGAYGVRVNLVSPGPVGGPRLDAVLEAQAQATGRPVQELREEYLQGSPLHRVVEAEQVASAVVFLASDQSGAITGEDLNVSAGATMY